ncbi:MAG: hypothetical protein SPH34_01525 [Lachnospiraceae bacterium]|uniref:hypothetical protein n=1 Tax=Galactobacillus timonensis TaxID=2041840 RepID=UPI0023F05EFD|nr:hypothetical protein [Galactobacillus timonensis]MDD7086652.1 hypothetical protein [Galactobacillus timonensis]MDY5221985.1 hypothetical protein [Lachnospiraceae bacterium]
MPVALIILACLDLILGILLYVTVQQIQKMQKEIMAIDKKAAQNGIDATTALAKEAAHDRMIGDIYNGMRKRDREADDTYQMVIAIRNELAARHMKERKQAGATKD